MRTFLSRTARAVLLPALLVCSATPGTAGQQPDSPPVSLERIKKALAKPAPPRLSSAEPIPVKQVFKSRVDQRVFVPTLEEVLHKQFDLTDLQRQSAQWAAQCCGLDIGRVMQLLDDKMRERKIRKTREQIARELAEIEAARKRIPPIEIK